MSKQPMQACVQACPARLFGEGSSSSMGRLVDIDARAHTMYHSRERRKRAFTHRLVLEDLVANRIFRHGCAAPLSSPRT